MKYLWTTQNCILFIWSGKSLKKNTIYCHYHFIKGHFNSWRYLVSGLPRWHSSKESTCQCRRCKRHRFDPWVGKIPWRRKWQPTPVFLPGKFHGQRRVWRATVHGVGKALDMAEGHACTGLVTGGRGECQQAVITGIHSRICQPQTQTWESERWTQRKSVAEIQVRTVVF